MTTADRVDKAIAAAASGPPPAVEPHTFLVNLDGDRRFVAMAPIDMTDDELMAACSLLLREGRASLRAERARREAGLVIPSRPILVPR